MAMKRFVLTVIIGLCAVTVQAAITTDGLGRSMSLATVPQRIVSLTPALTELLFALEVQPRLVGVTHQCDYPAAARAITAVGDYGRPNLEAILSVAPDLVVIDAAGGSPRLVERLESVGIPVYVVKTGGLSQTVAMFRQVGTVVGAADKGEQLARQLAALLQSAQPLGQAISAIFCVSLQPLVVAAPETLPGEILQHLGAKNLVPSGGRRYPQWTVEALIDADPQLILVAEMNGLEDRTDFFARLPVLQAVQRGRIIAVDPDLVFRPGPRLGQGVQQVQRALKQGVIDAD